MLRSWVEETRKEKARFMRRIVADSMGRNSLFQLSNLCAFDPEKASS